MIADDYSSLPYLDASSLTEGSVAMLSSVATASSELFPEESSEDDLFLGLLGLMQFLENEEF